MFLCFGAFKLSFFFFHSWLSLSWLCCCAWQEFVLSQWTGTIAECKNPSVFCNILQIYFEFWVYGVIWNMLSHMFLCHQCGQRHQHVYLLVTCVFSCVADTRGSWKLSLQDQQVRSSFDVGTVPTACGFYHLWMHRTTCRFTVARLFFLKSSVYHLGNQGLMDILDMPNTNKYSFEGWDNTFIFKPFCHTLLKGAGVCNSASIVKNFSICSVVMSY